MVVIARSRLPYPTASVDGDKASGTDEGNSEWILRSNTGDVCIKAMKAASLVAKISRTPQDTIFDAARGCIATKLVRIAIVVVDCLEIMWVGLSC